METAMRWLLQEEFNIGKAILMALIVLVVGRWIAGAIKNKLRNTMEKRNVDPAIIPFGTSIIYYVLMIVVVLAALQQVGFQSTSLIAVLGAAGLAVGLALQGTLSNFASGVLIIMFRPFKIGDFIDAGEQAGVVQEIGVLVTIIIPPTTRRSSSQIRRSCRVQLSKSQPMTIVVST